ncbi:uncharacterized protein TRIADDRAFT_54665 [Trichoplax adhaerens]|uniref:Calcineurin-like phosphoesterase domain-containing protein n=1 Tax=Trichoplax adhaerens TaxID=10228 RepID=B3RSN1_TRIAD|nr:hypothetical protein TRIADDRAFT_54665 [Trichoplax adhaerens]EDV27083.1 hypothetical protein TRIADDRAFT_54665 [Trichoplax adhaerens]|eukprot:XP_002111079.1 hypothetical protein TRIADDRAFT_54665 [Trichoplax adhaerens]
MCNNYQVYGDFGLKNDVSFNQLVTEMQERQFDMFLHVGDIAYDLHDDYGRTGDKFLRMIQPLTTTTPYMVLPGNHEHYSNFSQYQNRYAGMAAGVGINSGSNTNLWYSFDQDNIHFVAIDTEVYAYYSDPVQIERQIEWLAKDLKKANENRDKTPWIIMLAHKAWWMDRTDFSKFSPLLHKYGVDLFICGHQHNYQRLYPSKSIFRIYVYI